MTRVITQNGNNSINSDMEQKMTINGVSTCTIAGAEKYEKYQFSEKTIVNSTISSVQLIDLGLPSGTLWADRNLGADAPEECGDYYRFGEIVAFTEDSPEYVCNEVEGDIAGTDRDAATTILGKKFRMPTFKKIKELIELCSRQWTQINGVNGIVVTGPNGNSIFFPASGYRNYSSGSLYNVGSYGYYWSSSPYGTSYGHMLGFGSGGWCWSYYGRAYGYPVRAVIEEFDFKH